MSKLRDLARGQPCQVRIPGCCVDGDHSTTVLAHVRMAGITGVAMKAHDLLGAWCCATCHDVADGRVKTEYSKLELRVWHLEGVMRTQAALIRMGVLKS